MKQLLVCFSLFFLFACAESEPPTVMSDEVKDDHAFSIESLQLVDPEAKGSLFIIGGGKRPPSLVQEMIDLMPSKDSLIVIIPSASSEPDTSAFYATKQFTELGCTQVESFFFGLEQSEGLKSGLPHASLIYICGGDQNRFMEVVKKRGLKEDLHQAFKNGCVIAGTSAGAAVMSEVMITGDQQLEPEYESTYRRLKANNGIYSEGLGLLQHAIIDQHFVERSRYNRALTAMHDHPNTPVFGIGESTALVVSNNGFSVAGAGQVVLFSPGESSANENGLLEMSEVEITVMTAK
ncbi:cyanophycinase [Sanyastnella coralliicola]|uniref:cyanophycinase n=1 Tax=Sanyastnella coralliicola TaxID=3069118 RepID=UPI0027BAEC32|nr:cyanophycinase [Longitalea sp. SCSIO 12813]